MIMNMIYHLWLNQKKDKKVFISKIITIIKLINLIKKVHLKKINNKIISTKKRQILNLLFCK